jgi:oligopeptide/dipeptide ABC transporter ATP-binding protein
VGAVAPTTPALLEVEGLFVSFPTSDGLVEAVRGLDIHLERGKTLGIAGESGSGKSVATQTIVGLNQGARIEGRALFDGQDLLQMSGEELRAIRGAHIGLIFQDPLSSLHPFYRVGWQIAELIRAHEAVSHRAAEQRAVELLDLVGIPSARARAREYPHQFSGGMRQRAMIAMALALHPDLLIADEPTTALDVTVQAQVIELMKRLQAEFNMAIIMITHDLGVIADMADEVLVMYAGRAMERSNRRDAYYQPHHPYTVGLLDSLPRLGAARGEMRPIPGQPPSLIHPPPGCPFHPRCRFAMRACRADPPLIEVGAGSGHLSACLLPADLLGTGEVVDAERGAYTDAHDRLLVDAVVAEHTSGVTAS